MIEALQGGKDVYCEKPLTYAIDEGLEIAAAVKKSGKLLQVGSQGVSSQLQQKAREMIRSGKLGQVTMIRASYNRNTASGAWIYPIPPDASPETVDWQAFLGPAKKRPYNLERFFRWRCYRDYSGGIATDLFVHLCTTIHFIIIDALADCITDPREPAKIKHDVKTMLAQRVFGIALGYEDGNDHQTLRNDPMMQLLAEAAPDPDDPLASPSTLCRFENGVNRKSQARMSGVFVDQFIASYRKPPKEIILDFDATSPGSVAGTLTRSPAR